MVLGLIVITLFLGRAWFFRNYAWIFWVQVCIVQLHLIEEYLFPNKFIHWFNKEVCASSVKHKPLTREFSLALNLLNPIAFSVVAYLGSMAYNMVDNVELRGWLLTLPIATIWMMFHNAWFHITLMILRRGTLGVYTSIFLIIPFTCFSIYMYYKTEIIGLGEVVMSFILGGFFNYLVFWTMYITQKRFKRKSLSLMGTSIYL